MKVKIKHGGVLHSTPNAILVKNNTTNLDCWLPKKLIKFITGSEFKLIIPKWLAEKHSFAFSEAYHIPQEMEINYNQEAINELRVSD